jgi:glucosamine kinase
MGGFAEHVEPYLGAKVREILVPRLHDARDGAILLAGGKVEQPTMTTNEGVACE